MPVLSDHVRNLWVHAGSSGVILMTSEGSRGHREQRSWSLTTPHKSSISSFLSRAFLGHFLPTMPLQANKAKSPQGLPLILADIRLGKEF